MTGRLKSSALLLGAALILSTALCACESNQNTQTGSQTVSDKTATRDSGSLSDFGFVWFKMPQNFQKTESKDKYTVSLVDKEDPKRTITLINKDSSGDTRIEDCVERLIEDNEGYSKGKEIYSYLYPVTAVNFKSDGLDSRVFLISGDDTNYYEMTCIGLTENDEPIKTIFKSMYFDQQKAKNQISR